MTRAERATAIAELTAEIAGYRSATPSSPEEARENARRLVRANRALTAARFCDLDESEASAYDEKIDDGKADSAEPAPAPAPSAEAEADGSDGDDSDTEALSWPDTLASKASSVFGSPSGK